MKKNSSTKKTINAVTLGFLIIIFSSTVFSEIIIQQNEQNTNTNSTIKDEFQINYYSLIKEFSLSSQLYTIPLCSCETYADKINVKNTGSQSQSFQIKTNNPYSKLSLEQFSLTPNESIDIMNYIKAPCDKEVEQEYDITLTNDIGKTKILTQGFLLGNCQSLILEGIKTNATSLPCQTSEFQVKIINPSLVEEYYYFELYADKLEFNLSKNNLTLQPNKNETIKIIAKPSCEQVGDKQIQFVAYAQKNRLKAQLPLNLTILNIYNHSLFAPEKIDSCLGIQQIVPIKIKNNANLTNNYSLSVKKGFFQTEYAYFENKTTQLRPGEEKNVNLIIKKQNTVTTKKLTLTTKSILGDKTEQKELLLNISNCYDFELITNDQTVSDKNKYLNYTIINKGTKPIKINATLFDGPGFVERKEVITTIQPNNNLTLKHKVNSFVTNYPDYKITIRTYEYNTDRTLFENFVLNVEQKQETYNTKIITKQKYYTGNNGTKNHSFSIINKGDESEDYYIQLNTSAFVTPQAFLIKNVTPNKEVIINFTTKITNETQKSEHPLNINAEVVGSDTVFLKKTIIKIGVPFSQKISQFIQMIYAQITNFFNTLKNIIITNLLIFLITLFLILIIILVFLLIIRNKKQRKIIVIKKRRIIKRK